MTGDLVLGIDLGTQSTRAAVIDMAGQTLTAASSPEQAMHILQVGWAEQDPELWWQHVQQTVASCLKNVSPERIAAVGVSGQMHGCVPLDKAGNLLSRSVQLWCDKRHDALARALNARPDADALQDLAANPALASWHGLKINWLKTHVPETYQRTNTFLTPKDFINYRLTGEVATDYSEASGSFLMNAASRNWSPQLLQALELDPATLPSISSSSEVIGRVQTRAAAVTGLPPGTPVVAGGGDMLCTLLAAGLTKPGIASDITGTSAIFSVFTPQPVTDRRIMNLHHVLDGWIPFGLLDSGGVALRWFRDAFCQAEVAKASEQGISAYTLLSDLAEARPPDPGLICLPHLMGERTLGSAATRAVFFGLTPQHGVGDLARAVMAGVTYDMKRVLQQVEAEGFEVETVYHSGGGARSAFWSQLKADIYQKPVKTFRATEGGLSGAAILAATGVGFFDTAATGAAQWLEVADSFEPDPRLKDVYEAQFELFIRVHELLQPEFVKLDV